MRLPDSNRLFVALVFLLFGSSRVAVAAPVVPKSELRTNEVRWITVTNSPIEVCGLPWFKENGGSFSRLPVGDKQQFRPPVWSLAQSPSGARLRFHSDSTLIALKVEYSGPPNMVNMHAFGQAGIDLYADNNYIATGVPDKEAKPGKVYEPVLLNVPADRRTEHEFTLYLPLYKSAKVLAIGVDPVARVTPPKPFPITKPIVFYGTSITQGGAASRPGMSYEAILSRSLNFDFVNLGFSGNGLGEPEVAKAVAEIDATCFVLDFGANHKSGVDMQKVYSPFIDVIRAKHPSTPIIAVSPIYTTRERRDMNLKEDWQQRRDYIHNVVQQRVAKGDQHLSFVEGTTLLGPTQGDGLVDGSHPNDLGFQWMANGLEPHLKKVLAEQAKNTATNSNRIVPPLSEWRDKIPASLHSTKPDFVVFQPQVASDEVNDTGNEHFLVFDGPDKSLMAVWTQSTREGEPDQHIVFVQSKDEGKTWTKPRIIAGPAKPGEGLMASWAFPMVSKKGRIYVLYSQHVGKVDTFPHTTGQLTGIYSDDNGKSWSKPQIVTVPRTSRDNPDTTFPANCITWQKPLRLTSDGKYFVGLTRWTSKAVKKNPTRSWISHDSVVEFMRFDNIDDQPEPSAIKISWCGWDKDPLSVPYPGYPETSVCQEPALVTLPDGRFFCVMRTMTGSPYWSVSADDGKTWTKPQPLLRKDGGEPLKHPLSPSPIFDLGGPTAASGTYALFIHNHDGHYQGFGPQDTQMNRRPIYRVIGHFRKGADQPIWFDEPEFFFDHDGLLVGAPGKLGRFDLALYSSSTVVNGKTVLWYPDRKFFLLGKVISK